ncbi:MAG: DNA recombination protein RmuC [Patescibacteria group bacterium]
MDTTTLVFMIFAAVALLATVLILYISKKFRDMEEIRRGDQGLSFLNQNIQSLQQNLADSISKTTNAVNERLDNAARVIMAVNSELGQMKEIGTNLKNVQDFLKSPKLRGNLGEQGLKDMLSKALPRKYYDIQYAFRNGSIVDAIIHLDAGKIPIDSKFPLENFNQMIKTETEIERLSFRRKFKDDFKKHVNAISEKYIQPGEGTADFAFMYIPSESIYFEIINNEEEMFEYSANKHVIVSSPSTFFHYLRTIMLGLESKRVTEMSREILMILKTVKQESGILGDNISVLSKHLGNAGKTMISVNEQFSKLSDKIERVDLLEINEDKLLNK